MSRQTSPSSRNTVSNNTSPTAFTTPYGRVPRSSPPTTTGLNAHTSPLYYNMGVQQAHPFFPRMDSIAFSPSGLNYLTTHPGGPLSVPICGLQPNQMSPASIAGPNVPYSSIGRPYLRPFLTDNDPRQPLTESRYIVLQGVDAGDVMDARAYVRNAVLDQLQAWGIQSCTHAASANDPYKLDVYLRFDDVRDAQRFMTTTCIRNSTLQEGAYSARYVTREVYFQVDTSNVLSQHPNAYEGQILITVLSKFAPTLDAIEQRLVAVATAFGEVRACRLLSFDRNNAAAEYRLEFYSLSAACMAQTHMSCASYKVAAFQPFGRKPSPNRIDRIDSATTAFINGSPFDRERPDNRSRSGRHSRHGSDRFGNDSNANFVIDYAAVRSGQDTRTSVMIRNIPNRMTWEHLKHVLDRFCFGKFDFFYLRIDFKTGMNVGYAFVNFISTEPILTLLDHLVSRPWPVPFRDLHKHVQISYACSQGVEALVERFRNSSVMLECPHFRPKLFFTVPHVRAGEERPFPGTNNPSKMHRSSANANRDGLFPPGQARQSTANSRFKSSTSSYDRGTLHHQLEQLHLSTGTGQAYRPPQPWTVADAHDPDAILNGETVAPSAPFTRH